VGFGMAGMMQQSMAPQQQYQQQAPSPMQQGPANPFGAPPPAPSVQFHIHFNDQQMGPYGVDVLQQGVQSGQFTAETPVWKQGMAAWTPAGQVPELAHLFGGGGAPPPPSEPRPLAARPPLPVAAARLRLRSADSRAERTEAFDLLGFTHRWAKPSRGIGAQWGAVASRCGTRERDQGVSKKSTEIVWLPLVSIAMTSTS
jgi:hypothetical protein